MAKAINDNGIDQCASTALYSLMQGNNKAVVWWVLWAAFLAGLPQFYIFLSPAKGTAPGGSQPLVVVALVPFFCSVVVRWFLLPRLKQSQTALPCFLVGIALSEMVAFLGLFIFAAYKDVLFALSAIGILQFAPYYASRYQ